jgi:vacuolar protein 8
MYPTRAETTNTLTHTRTALCSVCGRSASGPRSLARSAPEPRAMPRMTSSTAKEETLAEKLHNMRTEITGRGLGSCPATREALVKILETSILEEAKSSALANLSRLAESDHLNRAGILSEGCVPPVINMLVVGNGEQQYHAAGVVRHLATSPEARVILNQEGAIPPLVRMVSTGDESQKEPEEIRLARVQAAAALQALATNTANKLAIGEAGGMAPLLHLLALGDKEQQDHAVGALWNCATVDANRLAIVQAGGLSALVALTTSHDPRMKVNACGILLNLAADGGNRSAIAQAGAIAPLIALATSGTRDQKRFATALLTNLALDTDIKMEIEGAGLKVGGSWGSFTCTCFSACGKVGCVVS